MTRKEGLSVISSLLEEQARKEEAQRATDALQVELHVASDTAYQNAQGILMRYGELKTKNMNTGAGKGMVGSRIGSVTFRETPPLPIPTDSDSQARRGEIFLREEKSSRPGYSFGTDSLDVLYRKNDSELVVLFTIRRDKTKGLGDDLTSLKQFGDLGRVLELLEVGYREREQLIPFPNFRI